MSIINQIKRNNWTWYINKEQKLMLHKFVENTNLKTLATMQKNERIAVSSSTHQKDER